MDNILCDELLQEIFQKLPPSSIYTVTLVSKRWLFLYRSSKTSLSLRVITTSSLTSLLSQHLSLSSLSILSSSSSSDLSSAHLISTVTSSPFSSKLLSFRFLASPLSLSSLSSLSNSCTRLTSLSVSLTRPIFLLSWVPSFPCLRELSISLSSDEAIIGTRRFGDWENEEAEEEDAELGIESLCLAGIRGDDWGLGWLWKSCKKLKRLQLRSCQGIGGSYSSFVHCLHALQRVS